MNKLLQCLEEQASGSMTLFLDMQKNIWVVAKNIQGQIYLQEFSTQQKALEWIAQEGN